MALSSTMPRRQSSVDHFRPRSDREVQHLPWQTSGATAMHTAISQQIPVSEPNTHGCVCHRRVGNFDSTPVVHHHLLEIHTVVGFGAKHLLYSKVRAST